MIAAEGSAGGLLSVWREEFFQVEERFSSNRKVGVPCCIANHDEKAGLSYNRNAMEQFSEFIEDAGLIDLPLLGGQFTWSNKRTHCRLDCFLVAPEFFIAFPNLVQNLGPRSLSDHNIISLESVDVDWGPIPFKFYNHWRDIEGFSEMVKI
ncbi:hypothetical protein PTKIN_Ptkin17bG0137400 [Pterospermum kingtungense]